MPTFAAVDLGATSGRVVNVTIDASTIALDPVRRFTTRTDDGPHGLTWDVDHLMAEVRAGLVEARRRAPLTSVAVDGWGLDYGLLDGAGGRLGPVHAYRSSRTDGVMEQVLSRVSRDRIYAITGTQFLPFNTLYQLVAARSTAEYEDAAALLMVPDLVNHELCGSTTNDVTNASTTQLLDVRTRTWSDELVDAVGLRRDLLPDLHEPGTELGAVRGVDRSVDGLPVVAVASHDTASAVAGTPLGDDGDLYISCGTWALVGSERATPVTGAEALAANVTNELGVDGSVRLLKNVTGLWLLEECRRWWAGHGAAATSEELVAVASAVAGGARVVDPDDPRFVAPGDLPARIVAACRESGQPEPASHAEIVRTILDSLVLAWRGTVATVRAAGGLGSGSDRGTIHLVGGGSAIDLLGRLTASACDRAVRCGPAEATVVGNGLVQAVAAGVLDSVAQGRELVRSSLPARSFRPEPTLDWDALASRLEHGRSRARPSSR